MNWLKESNRQYHFVAGIVSALIGTLIGAILVAAAIEGKDCQSDELNQGIPPYSWNWRRWDWLDFLATVLGGVIGQAIVLGIVFIIKGWI